MIRETRVVILHTRIEPHIELQFRSLKWDLILTHAAVSIRMQGASETVVARFSFL